MYVIVWRLRPHPGRETAFEQAYGPAGAWTQLFRRGEGYLGTELLRSLDLPDEYVAIDRWASEEAYRAFRLRWADAYTELDRHCEDLTAAEIPLGPFDAVPPEGTA